MVRAKLVDTDEELEQILKLQDENHLDNLSTEDKQRNGFVTVRHNFDLLSKMNDAAPQIIVKDNKQVVAYALVMMKEFKSMIPVLKPMFEMFDQINYNNRKISDFSFYVMGQICIKDTYRGKGIFQMLYQKHKEVYSKEYDMILTEVSSSNIPSMKAHEKVGFKTIHQFKDQFDDWNIVMWDWEE